MERVAPFIWKSQIPDICLYALPFLPAPISEMSPENEAAVEALLDKRYEAGQYGEIEDWDEMSLEQKLENDGDIENSIKFAYQDGIQMGTSNGLYKAIKKELGDPNNDEVGFHIDFDNHPFLLLTHIEDAEKWLKQAYTDGFDPGNESILDGMTFSFDSDHDFTEFDEDAYNERLSEELPKE
jgi:hypothetical protein